MPSLRPRLRPLELFPVEVDGQSLICLRDPSGLTERLGFLPRPAALVAALCDGTRTLTDVATEFRRRTGTTIVEDQIAKLLEQLDEGLFLEGARIDEHRRTVLSAFRAAPRRAASHAGGGYAGGADELAATLDDWKAQVASEAEPPPLAAGPGAPALLVAPHIDFHRGGLTYARAYRALAGAPPDLVVVFGTDHNGFEHPFTLTRKDYETPLGAVPTDVALVDELAARLGADDLFADELHHRGEHSIEFQAVWLRHVFGADAPPMLPVLCGSIGRARTQHELPGADARVAGFIEALRRATAGRRVLVVAAADMAHVGPRFGDGPMLGGDRRRVEHDDRAALDAAARRDADGFFASIAAVEDRNRVCGLAPIWATLAYAGADGRPGTLVDYDQCRADDAGTSFVSIAAMRF
jgi:AmmeMemoRadiSam system protein B